MYFIVWIDGKCVNITGIIEVDCNWSVIIFIVSMFTLRLLLQSSTLMAFYLCLTSECIIEHFADTHCIFVLNFVEHFLSHKDLIRVSLFAVIHRSTH